MSYGTFETTYAAAENRYDKVEYRRLFYALGRLGLPFPNQLDEVAA